MATSITAIYSTRIIFFTLLGQPRFPPLININETNPILINPIKRLLIGSIFAGFILSNSIPPINIPLMTIPLYLKLTALIVTILGFILAFEINTYSKNLKYPYSSDSTKFSTLLGYFPTIIHRSLPHLTLTISQKFATSLLDLT
ncbi:MAG: hypothetical protein GY750_13070 [Lentisphaerae bacterium]|nr:hypothetical protein [Lentisphaerota bacterium]